MTDDEILRSLLKAATRDLQAPQVHARPLRAVVPLPTRRPADRTRDFPRRLVFGATAAATGAAAALVTVFGFGLGTSPQKTNAPTSGASGGGPSAVMSSGPGVLYQLAASVRTLPTPTGRYAVQIERQTEQGTSYLKATVVDSRTGDAWTYQRGPDVPATLPKATGFTPTEAQLRANYPTNPARLKQALIAQAAAANSGQPSSETRNDLAVTQAIETLWNPLVQPPLRAALVSVIAATPGVHIEAHTLDARGRNAINIGYDDKQLNVRWSVYLDPSTGAVLESAEVPTAGGSASLAGEDLYLSHYWTDASPTTNPLDHDTGNQPGAS